MEENGPRLSSLHILRLLRLPHKYPREIGPPWCMIRFLNSGLAAAPRGSVFCLSSLLMEQFCQSCSASHYCIRSKSQETRVTTTSGPRPEPTYYNSCATTVTSHKAILERASKNWTFVTVM